MKPASLIGGMQGWRGSWRLSPFETLYLQVAQANTLALIYTGARETPGSGTKLNKVTQLTGFSDPVYAEAYVHVNQYDIVLDVLIVNQTSK